MSEFDNYATDKLIHDKHVLERQNTQLRSENERLRVYAKELLYRMEADFDNPESELYDDGGIWHDMQEIKAALNEELGYETI